MNKAYSYNDVKNGNFRNPENAEFHSASASTERFSSLIFKTTSSDFQKIEPELAKFDFNIAYEESLSNLTVDGYVVNERKGQRDSYALHTIKNLTKQSSVQMNSSDNWLVENTSNCFVSNKSGTAKDILYVYFTDEANATIDIIEDITVANEITVTNGKIVIDSQELSSYSYNGLFSGCSAFGFKIIPSEGYELESVPTNTTNVEFSRTDDGYFVDFTKHRNNVTLAFQCTQIVPDAPPVTDIPINAIFTSGAFSSLKINGVVKDTASPVTGAVRSDVTSFTINYTLAENYSLSGVKVNGTSLSSFSSTSATVTLNGSEAYNIEFTTTYTVPITYRTIQFDNADIIDITINSPSSATVTKSSTNEGIVNIVKFESSITQCDFTYTVIDTTKYQVLDVRNYDGTVLNELMGRNKYSLADITVDTKISLVVKTNEDTPSEPSEETKSVQKLSFANNGSSKKWTTVNENGITKYASPVTMKKADGNSNVSYSIAFNGVSGTERLMFGFDSSGHIPDDNSYYFIKTSDTLITTDELVATYSSGQYKATNSFIKISQSNVTIDTTNNTVSIKLDEIGAVKKYIYVGFAGFTHSYTLTDLGKKIYLTSYECEIDENKADISTDSFESADGFFDGSVIIDGTVIQECDPTGESIPYNSYSFTIADDNNDYSPLVGTKANSFDKYQQFLIYGVVKDYALMLPTDDIIVGGEDEGMYVTQIARCRFNGIEHNNGIATFNFIGTLEYYDNIKMTDDEKQKYYSHTNKVKVADYLNDMFGSDISLDRVDNSGLKVFSDNDVIIVPFEDESKTEIVKTIAQAFGMFIFEDSDGKIRFHTLGDKFDSTETTPFKLELEQSFANPTVTAKDEEIDSVDLTYHTYLLGDLEDIQWGNIDFYYHLKGNTGSNFDCRSNDGYVLYYTTTIEDVGYGLDQNENKKVNGSALDVDKNSDYFKIRFNFQKNYGLSSLRFLTNTKTVFQLDNTFAHWLLMLAHIHDKNNLNATELNNLFVYSWRDNSSTNNLYDPRTYNSMPYDFEGKKTFPCIIITEKYVDIIFSCDKSSTKYTKYRSFWNNTVIDISSNDFDDNIFEFIFDAYLLALNSKGKPITDETEIYHYIPYGTKSSNVAIDNVLINNSISASLLSSKVFSIYRNSLYEVNNDWKGDCTVAVGDSILNSIPIGLDLNTKTYENYKTGIVKYNNYSLDNGLTCNTKLAMPKGLFYELEGKTDGVTTKVYAKNSNKNFKFSNDGSGFKV